MKPIEALEPGRIKQIDAVFFDIDDTFSLHSKILPQAYNALWNLKFCKFRSKLAALTFLSYIMVNKRYQEP